MDVASWNQTQNWNLERVKGGCYPDTTTQNEHHPRRAQQKEAEEYHFIKALSKCGYASWIQERRATVA